MAGSPSERRASIAVVNCFNVKRHLMVAICNAKKMPVLHLTWKSKKKSMAWWNMHLTSGFFCRSKKKEKKIIVKKNHTHGKRTCILAVLYLQWHIIVKEAPLSVTFSRPQTANNFLALLFLLSLPVCGNCQQRVMGNGESMLPWKRIKCVDNAHGKLLF